MTTGRIDRMRAWSRWGAMGFAAMGLSLMMPATAGIAAQRPARKTVVTIVGDAFHVNGRPTYEGRTWRGHKIEGLLMNSRMVQGIFDDLNPETIGRWVYPDTGEWDPDRNTQGFVDAMASWYEHGLRSFTINLQGGSPEGYSRQQPWHNSALRADGSLRPEFMARLERILDKADELGMVPMLGIYYFGQDGRLADEAAVIRGVENAVNWVLEKGYRNVLIEINNECNVRYDHPILQPPRVHELIELAKGITRDGRRLYVSTSYGGGTVPLENVVRVADFILLHGNGVRDPKRMEQMIHQVRAMDVYRGQPIVNNEDDRPWLDDHQGWGHEGNNFVACVKNYASWGYFDFRLNHELGDFNKGFQTVPANWQISSQRKRAFFDLVAEITGSPGTPRLELVLPEAGVIRAGKDVQLKVRVENKRANAPIERVDLLLNNVVVAEAEQAPFAFRLAELPAGEPMVRARATYRRGDREVIVESPYRTLTVLKDPGRVFVPADPGMVVLRAADYYEQTKGIAHAWVETEHPGASGPVLRAMPSLQQIVGPDRASPRLDYPVRFDEPGRYHVWVRGLAESGDEDSVHVGLNGAASPSTEHIYPFEPFGQWIWTNTNRQGGRAVLDVGQAGVHTVNVWMREDGFLLDRLLLTRDAAYKPEGEGPEPNPQKQVRKTEVSIRGDMFYINGRPTYEGRTWRGHKIEGLLMNSRMVQGIFDDLNPDTMHLWNYPDGPWDPDRNTNEFVAAMPSWRRHGLLCAVVNLQGGSPTGYGNRGWHNSAIESDGSFRADYMGRLERILDRADELGMVIMVGIFYFGQDQRLEDENAVKQAVINTVDWIADRGYTNVLLEIANEYPASHYRHDIIRERPEELIRLAQRRAAERDLSLPVSVSSFALRLPSQAVVDASDYILLHGNAIKDPDKMVQKIQTLRSMAAATPKPIVNNEDDSPWSPRRLEPGQKPPGWDTEGITNNFMACVKNYVSWGHFDWRRQDREGFDDGFQSVPVNWQISSERKRTFFNLLAKITGSGVG